MSLLMAVALGFTACNDDDGPDLDKVIEDGFYVSGDATGSAELEVAYRMAAGLNEVDGTRRAGMYEKYVALEANKEFYLLLYEAQVETRYSAVLEDHDTGGENDQPTVVLKRGALQTGSSAPAMTVSESGLYHIVLDLNQAGDLANAQIIVAPAQWGVRGAMNGWGFTAFDTPAFNRTSMTYTMTNVQVESTGEFKFAYGGGWKIQLDDAGNVKANTNLGNDTEENGEALMPNDQVPNGKDIAISRGIYTIKLTWKLASGDIKNSYVAEMTKTGSLEAVDYTNCEMELVGSGVADQPGATADPSGWSWGNVLSAGKPTVSGTVYTWTWNSVSLLNEGFKVRTINAEESGGVSGFDLGSGSVDLANSSAGVSDDDGNILAPAGTYKITLTIDAETDIKTIVITAQ